MNLINNKIGEWNSPFLTYRWPLYYQDGNMGLCKRNSSQSTLSVLNLLQGLPGYQHQHDFLTLTSRQSHHVADIEMHLDGVEFLSGSKTIRGESCHLLCWSSSTGTSGLDISDDLKRSGALMAHSDEPPPAPQIHSRGVIATDITQHFMNATKSAYMPQAWIRDSWLTVHRARYRSARQRWVLYVIWICWSHRSTRSPSVCSEVFAK